VIKAIIFDFDGTMLETEMPEYASWQEVYQQHQCELPISLWLEFVGKSVGTFDPYTHLESLVGRAIDRQAVRQVRRQRFNELLGQQTILPGVEAALIFAKEAGIRLAVASSSSREWVVGHLEQFGLLSYFDAICTADDVDRAKPDPAVYRLALERLGVAAHEAIAIEDSRNGLLAAKRAGLRCVVVPNALTCHSTFEEADLQVTSLAEVDWQQVCRAA